MLAHRPSQAITARACPASQLLQVHRGTGPPSPAPQPSCKGPGPPARSSHREHLCLHHPAAVHVSPFSALGASHRPTPPYLPSASAAATAESRHPHHASNTSLAKPTAASSTSGLLNQHTRTALTTRLAEPVARRRAPSGQQRAASERVKLRLPTARRRQQTADAICVLLPAVL